MTINDMHGLQSIAKKEGVVFFYSGYFSQKVLLAVGETIKQKMTADDVAMTTTKKIFTVFVEQVQNIIRYSSERIGESPDSSNENELSYGLIVIGKESNDKFFMCCGNHILEKDKERLETNLRQIQKMDKEELKKAYKEKLKEGPDEHSKGAGIGFLEIARKASEPIEFDFKKIDEDNNYFFFLQAYI